jgi:drug/metabolite transporter (DMT)-like permease
LSLTRRRRYIAIAAGVLAIVILSAAPFFVDPQFLGTIALWVGTVASAGNIIGYFLWARWWESEYGWNIMYFNVSLGAVFSYALVRAVTGHSPPPEPGVDTARYVVFGVVAFGMAWRLWILIRKQLIDPYRERGERK